MIVQKEVRQHLVLPFEATVKLGLIKDKETRAAYVYALRCNKWTLQSVANAMGLTRERIRQIESSAQPSLVLSILANPGEFPMPSLPVEDVEVKGVHVPILPSKETLDRLLELQPLAQKVRYDHKQYRAEAEEYSALIWKAHTVEKVTLYRLAKSLGVTHGALRFRLARYGYIQHKGKSTCYTPVKSANRVSQ
jgi:transcriptional regulator with XRE-family HTH domain